LASVVIGIADEVLNNCPTTWKHSGGPGLRQDKLRAL